jgi:predicted O-methyltransferase YrrM
MDLVHPEVDRYLAGIAAPSDPVLLEMEGLAAERGFPIVGPQVGRLLHVLASASGARRVLELGSGFGYSALWFARAVGPEGLVVLTEGSPERAREAGGFLARAGLEKRVRIEVGNALEIASRESGPFDLVFNDIDKEDYPKVAGLAARLLRPGGLLVSDNMLWCGRVLGEGPGDAETRGVRELIRLLYAPEPFFTALVPLRDGVTVSVRS